MLDIERPHVPVGGESTAAVDVEVLIDESTVELLSDSVLLGSTVEVIGLDGEQMTLRSTTV